MCGCFSVILCYIQLFYVFLTDYISMNKDSCKKNSCMSLAIDSYRFSTGAPLFKGHRRYMPLVTDSSRQERDKKADEQERRQHIGCLELPYLQHIKPDRQDQQPACGFHFRDDSLRQVTLHPAGAQEDGALIHAGCDG